MTPEEKGQFISDVSYFYQYKGLERMGSLDEKIGNFPELNMAWNNMKLAELALKQAVENLTKEDY